MDFFTFILLLAIAYLLWRISDQLPDILFRLSEVQRDIAEIRRRGDDDRPAAADTQADAEEDGSTETGGGSSAAD